MIWIARTRVLPAFLIAFSAIAVGQHPADAPPTSSTQPLKFSYARRWRGCSPVDEPESGITLTTVLTQCTKKYDEPARPYISVMFEDGTKTAQVKIVYASGIQTAWATRCLAGREKCDQATGGTINLDDHSSKDHLPSYELHFADGSVEKGTFTLHPDCHPDVQCW